MSDLIPKRDSEPWPITRSAISVPASTSNWLTGIVLILVGLSALWLADPPSLRAMRFDLTLQQNARTVIGTSAGIASTALGTIVLFASLPWFCSSRPFAHADPDVLPKVPQQATRTDAPCGGAQFTHRLRGTPDGFRLEPKPGLPQRLRRSTLLQMIGVALLILGVVAALPVQIGTMVWLLLGVLVFGTATGIASVRIRNWRFSLDRLVSFEADAACSVGIIEQGDEHQPFPLDEVIALQLGVTFDGSEGWPAFWRGRCRACVGLNLVQVEQSGDEANPAASLQRIVLVRARGGFASLIPVALQVAHLLGVPLLNHATPAHWQNALARPDSPPRQKEHGAIAHGAH